MRVTRGKEEGRLTRERTGPTYERKGEHDKKTYSPCSPFIPGLVLTYVGAADAFVDVDVDDVDANDDAAGVYIGQDWDSRPLPFDLDCLDSWPAFRRPTPNCRR